MAEGPDPLARLRGDALAAFEPGADTTAPGLRATLLRSVDYVVVDRARSQLVIDRRALLLAVTAVGLEPAHRLSNSAGWFAHWLASRLPNLDLARICAQVRTSEKSIDEAAASGFVLVVSASVGTCLKAASGFAEATVGREQAALRHLFLALIDDPNHQLEIKEFSWLPGPADIADLRRTLFERIAASPEPGERMEVWRQLLGLPEASPSPSPAPPSNNDGTGGSGGSPTGTGTPAPPPPPAAPAFFVSGFDADRTSGGDGDPLETDADILAMARLICHEDADPPISIGVFGGWGSGKSTFMEALQRQVGALSRSAESQPADGPRFVSPVVQIRFNAWQFADANLWASLTAEFFDQLRAGGFEGGGKRIHAELIEEVNEHVRGLSHEAARQRAALAEADRKVRDAQSAHDEAVKNRSASVQQALVSGLAEAFEQNKGDLTRYGLIDRGAADKLSEFIALARDARSEWGRVRRIPAILAAQWPLLVALLLVAGLVAVGAFLLSSGGRTAAAVAGLLTVAAGLLPVIRRGLDLIDAIVRRVGPFVDKLNDADKEGLRKVLETEVALRSAASEAEALRAASERAERALARYVDPAARANPPRVLRYLLEDDPDTRAFEKELGLIGRARRLFQALDQIVAENRGKRERLQAIRALPSTSLGPAEWEERERLTNAVDDEIPDRIILYIDDLDRCTHEQVYKVLQAVHLLLAFELFVVVVAVDVEWVEAAVAKSIEFAGPESGTDEAKDEDRRKRAIKYLAKIFQLPFWLRSFSGKDDARYGKYVRSLTRAAAPAAPPPPGAPGGDGGDGASDGGGKAPPPPPPDRGETAVDGSRPKEAADQGADKGGPKGVDAPKPDAAAVARALRTLQLTRDEEDFLAGPEISALAAADPRGVKRLVNVYKIARARLSETDDGIILGGNGRAPAYPLIALCAAVETGQPLEIADAFYDALKAQSKGVGLKSLDAGVQSAVAAAVAARNGCPVTPEDMLKVAGVVRRYSFNRYH